MSLSLLRVPDGPQEKGQSTQPCPSVYSPAPALGSLSSVALSSVQALGNLAQTRSHRPNYRQFRITISSGFLDEATNSISSGFLREARGLANALGQTVTPKKTRSFPIVSFLFLDDRHEVNSTARADDRILVTAAPQGRTNDTARLAKQVTIYCDIYDVPHVFGRTDAATVFGFWLTLEEIRANLETSYHPGDEPQQQSRRNPFV